jgi:hypothetical protein
MASDGGPHPHIERRHPARSRAGVPDGSSDAVAGSAAVGSRLRRPLREPARVGRRARSPTVNRTEDNSHLRWTGRDWWPVRGIDGPRPLWQLSATSVSGAAAWSASHLPTDYRHRAHGVTSQVVEATVNCHRRPQASGSRYRACGTNMPRAEGVGHENGPNSYACSAMLCVIRVTSERR